MKQTIIVILIIFEIILFTACSNNTDTSKLNSNEVTDSLDRENTLELSQENTIDGGSDQSSRFYIVAESGNSISSADKEKVIKKLDDELGVLFDSINNPEDN